MDAWVLFTLLAAVMQAIRTAGQKKMALHLSPMTTTLVRYLFGLPFVAIYLVCVINDYPQDAMARSVGNMTFILYASLASVAQILATVWLVKVLRLRNFAVGTIFSKTEVIQTAVFGVVFFGAFLSVSGWLAVLLGLIGILILSRPGQGQAFDRRSMFYGMLSGLGLAFTALWLRQASLSLDYSVVENAAITLLTMVCLQTLICLLYVAVKERHQFSILKQHMPLAIFVGATSAMGSVGWCTAMTYENAALVRSLGQVELVFTLLITYFFFNEKIASKEFVGIAAIVASVLIILLYT